MAELLKDRYYTPKFVNSLCREVTRQAPTFDAAAFEADVHDAQWSERELKARMQHIAACLRRHLPDQYPAALEIINAVAPGFSDLDGMVFPEFVGMFGLSHWEISVPALAHLTRYSSSEFAIRPFIAADPERAMPFMLACADDENLHVRRFASEGCRPRLPWAMALPAFKRDPAPILPVLERLRADREDYVRRSVANNLNDIAKDNPDTVLAIAQRWYGSHKHTDWIVKHACRSLLRQSDPQALKLFGFLPPDGIKVEDFTLRQTPLSIGDDLNFQFAVYLPKSTKIRLEYIIEYVKANGKRTPKVFQISEREMPVGRTAVQRKQSVADLSTRRHFPGEHIVAIRINGVVLARERFYLDGTA